MPEAAPHPSAPRSTAAPGTLFCFGCGYVARHLAAALLREGWTVRGTTRDPGKAAELRAAGIEPLLFARGRPLDDPARALAGVSHVLVSIPPDEAGDPVLDGHGADLRALSTLRWVGWLGTTAVYGDRQGGWASEEDEPRPGLARAKRRLRAERAWLASGLPVHIFRLAGIYGPGRNAIRSLLEGRARRIVKTGQVFGRIHVEDIVAVLRASMERPHPGRVYNVVDDEPAPPQDVVAFAASLLGIAPPPEIPFGEADLSPAAREFYAECRRVRNDRIKAELGIELLYPTYREGLRALLPVELAAGASTEKPSRESA